MSDDWVAEHTYTDPDTGEVIFVDPSTGRVFVQPPYTLREYWNDNVMSYADPQDSGEFRIGPYTLLIPPDSIQVSQTYAPISSYGPSLRQANSPKMASGRLVQNVNFSFVAPEQGLGEELYDCTLVDILILFKGVPFCPVQNWLLNEVYGIDALAFREWSVETISGYPNSFRVTVACEAFNYHIYLDSNDFASQIDYNKLKVYLTRGKTQYMNVAKSNNKNDVWYDNLGRPYERPNWPGNQEFDLLFPTESSVDLNFDMGVISAGDSLLYLKNYLEEKGLAELNLDEGTSVMKALELITSFGWLQDTFSVGLDVGQDSSPETYNFTKTANLISYILEVTDPGKMQELAMQWARQNPALMENGEPTTEAYRLAAAYMAQTSFDQLKTLAEDFGTPLHQSTKPWADEVAIRLQGLDVSEALVVQGLSIRSGNVLAPLPTQLAEGHALQYMGGDDTYARLTMICHGDEDLKKIMAAFRFLQAMVRATRSVVNTGFIGLRSPLTVVCGTTTFLPMSMQTSTIPGFPHTYAITLNLVGFDIWQQEREKLQRLVEEQSVAESWKGHPLLRIEDGTINFNFYPDLYLIKDEDTGEWENPDMYFIATPEYVASDFAARTSIIYNGQPDGLTLEAGIGPDGVYAQTSLNSEPFNLEGPIKDTLPTEYSGIGYTKSTIDNPTHTDGDVNFAENLRDAYQNYQATNLRGHMCRAFPTFFFAFVDEPRNFLYYRTYCDYYSRRGINSITVNRSTDPMQEVAMIQLTDIYRRLSFDSSYHTDSTVMDQGWWINTIYQDTTHLFQKLGASDIESVVVQPGMRIHIRMGYSNSITDMRVVFNGTVTEVEPDSDGMNMTVVAQGDGRELLGVINVADKGQDTADLSGLYYSEPRELVVRLLTMRSSAWRSALALATNGAFHPDPKNGIRHFGELLPNRPEEWMGMQEGSETLNEYNEALATAHMNRWEEIRREFIEDQKNILMYGAYEKINKFVTTGITVGTDGMPDYTNASAKEIEMLIDSGSLLNAVITAIENIWNGWDQNIFSRNIYPGTRSGLLEDIGTSDQSVTGAGGGTLWDQFKYAISDAFDFFTNLDEPNFKAMCVSDDTECLSKDLGWVRYDKLKLGDEILTLNNDTGKCEWKPVNFVYSNMYNGNVDRIKNGKGLNVLVTPGHRWPVQTHHRSPRTCDKHVYSDNFSMREDIYHVSYNERIPLSRELSSYPTTKIYSDEFVELVGWFITEGWYGIYNGRTQQILGLCQSNRANPEKVSMIRSCLDKLGIHYNEDYRKDHEVFTWYLGVNESKDILSIIDDEDKSLSISFIHSLTKEQLILLYNTVHLGDGSYNGPAKYQQKVLIQKSKTWLDRIQIITTLLGIATHQRVRDDNGISVLSSLKNNYKDRHQLKVSEEQYNGIVWCPNTDNGTFVARKNGYVFITGNTYGRSVWDLIQQCADLVPNYIVAVRPFMHRSTLFMGKPFWKYTSGVVSTGENGKYPIVLPSLQQTINDLGYYQVRVFLTEEEVKTEQMSFDLDRILSQTNIFNAPSERIGLDYSDNTHSSWIEFFAKMRSDGYTFIGRYLYTDVMWKLPMFKAEFEQALKSGIDVFLIYERGPGPKTSENGTAHGARPYDEGDPGAIGSHDAQDAQHGLRILGLNQIATTVYFSLDGITGIPSATQLERIGKYFQGISRHIPVDYIGVYGSYTVIDYLWKNGLASYFWQATWMGGSDGELSRRSIHEKAQIHQVTEHGEYAGIKDTDKVYAHYEDFGQVRAYDYALDNKDDFSDTPADVSHNVVAAEEKNSAAWIAKLKAQNKIAVPIEDITNWEPLNISAATEGFWEHFKEEINKPISNDVRYDDDADLSPNKHLVFLLWNNLMYTRNLKDFESGTVPQFREEWAGYYTGASSPKNIMLGTGWNEVGTDYLPPPLENYGGLNNPMAPWDLWYSEIVSDTYRMNIDPLTHVDYWDVNNHSEFGYALDSIKSWESKEDKFKFKPSFMYTYVQSGLMRRLFGYLSDWLMTGSGFLVYVEFLKLKYSLTDDMWKTLQAGDGINLDDLTGKWTDKFALGNVKINGIDLDGIPETAAQVCAIAVLETLKQNGIKFDIEHNNTTHILRYKVSVNGESQDFGSIDWIAQFDKFWQTPAALDALTSVATGDVDVYNSLESRISDFFGGIANVLEGLITLAGGTLEAIVEWIGGGTLGVISGLLQAGLTLADTSNYLRKYSSLMSDALYTSTYDWSPGSTRNPFTREFGEPVAEVREVFCKFHKIDSLRNIVSNHIIASADEVYPVVTSVTNGGKPKTVYADKSIAPEFQKELVYENYLNFDVLNFRDGIHAKRIGLAAMARSLRTMYQGSIDILGDNSIEPWDFLFIADTVTDMWGVCQVREVTQIMDASMGFITQISVQPIVAVDDPAQWAVSTLISGWFGGNRDIDESLNNSDTELSRGYYGDDAVAKMIDYYNKDPDRHLPTDYTASVGAGMAACIVAAAVGLTMVAAGGPAAAAGTLSMTGLAGILNPEALAEIPQYFDEQQDVWIQLLTRRNEPFQAGLTGATGIVVGRQKSVGLDILDMFSSDRAILTEDELYSRMGLDKIGITQWELDMQYYRSAAVAQVMTQDFINSIWNPPEPGASNNGYEIYEATVSSIIDGDTFYITDPVRGKVKVRIAGIDAPESPKGQDGVTDTSKTGDAVWIKGIASYEKLASIMPIGSSITLYVHPRWPIDSTGNRLLAFPMVGETNVAIEMVTTGHAQIYGYTE